MVFCRKELEAPSPLHCKSPALHEPLTEAVQDEQEATHLQKLMLVGWGTVQRTHNLLLLKLALCRYLRQRLR